MRLKTDISENIDYVIVCEGVWYGPRMELKIGECCTSGMEAARR